MDRARAVCDLPRALCDFIAIQGWTAGLAVAPDRLLLALQPDGLTGVSHACERSENQKPSNATPVG
jgi:hypothetical protein